MERGVRIPRLNKGGPSGISVGGPVEMCHELTLAGGPAHSGYNRRPGGRWCRTRSDLQRSTVEFVAEGRKTESLAACYAQLTDEQKAAPKAVATDMWVYRRHT